MVVLKNKFKQLTKAFLLSANFVTCRTNDYSRNQRALSKGPFLTNLCQNVRKHLKKTQQQGDAESHSYLSTPQM